MLLNYSFTIEYINTKDFGQYPPNPFGLLLQADLLIQFVIDYTKSGKWPKVKRHSPLWYYYNSRNVIMTVEGQTRMKMLTKTFVYWPTIYSDIEILVRTCPKCASVAKDLVKAVLQSWPKLHSPLTRVHADFVGPMER
ncbi:hypothetical protein RB195_024467 [Necator americanus]|uniref:RNA-directed DNA polymerase n=1 Tax=Necator americanus TaxID=51031 RepID=A0ABR1ENA6_NECAM